MAQAPATPKLARWRRLAVARLFGGRAGPGLSPSESAALALRARGIPSPPTAPTVTFLLPLVGRHHVQDWEGVSARLRDTLGSFQRQTDPEWRAVVCGQDAPTGLPDDPRIRFLPFDEEVEGNDKWRKLNALAHAYAQDSATEDGYAMPFDADDLLAPTQVAHMRQARAPGGYLVTRGYVVDQGRFRVALAAPRSLTAPRQRAFWKMCGSCAAFRVVPGDGPDFLASATAHEHRMFPYLAALAGRPLQPLPEPAALYLLNHGDNFGARRGRVTSKAHFVERHALRDPARLGQITRAFWGGPEAADRGLGAMEHPGS